MRRFAEVVWITLVCSTHFVYFMQPERLALYLLVTFGASLLLEILFLQERAKGTSFAVMAIFLIGLLAVPELRFFAPVLAYSAFPHIKWLSLLFFIRSDLLSITIGVTAVYFSYLWLRYYNYIQDNMRKSDELKEKMISLEMYNKKLLENEEKKQEIVRLEERNRIARELHDSLGHTISSSILQLEALKLTETMEMRKDSLQLLQDTLQTGMMNIRGQLHGMYDTTFSLNKKLEELKHLVPNVEIRIQNELTSALSFAKNWDIYSIIREALTNTMKHSDADEFQVFLKEQGNNQVIMISDNGSKEVSGVAEGMGMSGMKEIVEKYYGKINYYYRNGFIIHVVFGAEQKNDR